MFTTPPYTAKETRIHNESEYRNWQLSLRGFIPAPRREPGLLTRLVNLLRSDTDNA